MKGMTGECTLHRLTGAIRNTSPRKLFPHPPYKGVLHTGQCLLSSGSPSSSSSSVAWAGARPAYPPRAARPLPRAPVDVLNSLAASPIGPVLPPLPRPAPAVPAGGGVSAGPATRAACRHGAQKAWPHEVRARGAGGPKQMGQVRWEREGSRSPSAVVAAALFAEVVESASGTEEVDASRALPLPLPFSMRFALTAAASSKMSESSSSSFATPSVLKSESPGRIFRRGRGASMFASGFGRDELPDAKPGEREEKPSSPLSVRSRTGAALREERAGRVREPEAMTGSSSDSAVEGSSSLSESTLTAATALRDLVRLEVLATRPSLAVAASSSPVDGSRSLSRGSGEAVRLRGLLHGLYGISTANPGPDELDLGSSERLDAREGPATPGCRGGDASWELSKRGRLCGRPAGASELAREDMPAGQGDSGMVETMWCAGEAVWVQEEGGDDWTPRRCVQVVESVSMSEVERAGSSLSDVLDLSEREK